MTWDSVVVSYEGELEAVRSSLRAAAGLPGKHLGQRQNNPVHPAPHVKCAAHRNSPGTHSSRTSHARSQPAPVPPPSAPSPHLHPTHSDTHRPPCQPTSIQTVDSSGCTFTHAHATPADPRLPRQRVTTPTQGAGACAATPPVSRRRQQTRTISTPTNTHAQPHNTRSASTSFDESTSSVPACLRGFRCP